MRSDESRWLAIIDEDVRLLQASHSHHRNSLIVLLAGISSVAWSILAVIDNRTLTRHDIPFVAPFFLSMIWFSGAVMALAMIYHRRSLLPIEEAIRAEAAHGLLDASDLLAGAIDAIGLTASVFTIFLLWNSGLNLGLELLYSIVVIYSGFACSVQISGLFSRKGLLQIFLDYMGFPKRRRRKPTKQKPSPGEWTLKNVRVAITGFIMGSVVLLMAWQLMPRTAHLLLGTLLFVSMYLAKSSFTQYGRMVETDNAISESTLFRQWLITGKPDSDQIEEKYKLLRGIKDEKSNLASEEK